MCKNVSKQHFVDSHSKVRRLLLTEKQVAEHLNVSVQTLRKWRANGVGPTWNKLEGCIRYPVAGLEQYIADTRCDFMGQDKTRSSSNNGGKRHG